MRFMLVVVFLVAGLTQAQTNQGLAPGSPQENRAQTLSQSGSERIAKEVHHELVLLPYYGVFDNLAYRVSPDGTVTLLGQVAYPTLKSDAENAVKRIEGVERVDNQIQILPTSPMDGPDSPCNLSSHLWQ